MKSLLILCALCALASAAVTPKYKEKMFKALETCNKDAKLEKDVVQKLVGEVALPANEKEKCFAGCVLKEIGLIANGHFVLEESLKQNKEKFTGDNIIKADGVAQKCAETAPKESMNECDLAFEILKCSQAEKKAVNLPPPQYE